MASLEHVIFWREICEAYLFGTWPLEGGNPYYASLVNPPKKP